MRASSSSSACNSSTNITRLNKRLKTIFNKAYELSVLCEIEVCVIHYGADGKLKTWPEEREKVKDMALRYATATKRKKSLNLHEFMEKEREKQKKKPKKQLKKKKKIANGFKYPVWCPIFDHYSPNQLSQLVPSLEQTLSKLQERLRFVEAQKQRETNLVQQSSTPLPLNQHHQQQYQTQPLNPNKFSVYMYNREDATLSQLPLSASQSNELTNYQNYLMRQQQLQYYSALRGLQESGLKNNLMLQQQEFHGFDQNTVPQHPYLSNTVSNVSCSDFHKNTCGDMVASTSFSQDISTMFSSYDQNNLIQTPLNTIPNIYCLPDK